MSSLKNSHQKLEEALRNLEEQEALAASEHKQKEDEFLLSKAERDKLFSQFMEKSETEKNSAIAAFSENHSLGSALTTWKNKAQRHQLEFYFGLALLCVILISTFFVFVFKIDLVQFLARLKKPDGDYPYVTIILFLLPAVALAWLLRIGGKFVTGSLMLRNDAEQRFAMLDTYIRLIHEGQATREDRTIVLAALFRALPGQENDDMQPPSLLDLMKKDK